MKLMHLSDLHLGKRVNGFSMLEEQRFILEQILQLVHAEQPQGVLLAGDLFDKPTPPAEAVSLLDDFLAGLSHLGCTIFAISGQGLALAAQFLLHQPDGSALRALPQHDAGVGHMQAVGSGVLGVDGIPGVGTHFAVHSQLVPQLELGHGFLAGGAKMAIRLEDVVPGAGVAQAVEPGLHQCHVGA